MSIPVVELANVRVIDIERDDPLSVQRSGVMFPVPLPASKTLSPIAPSNYSITHREI